MATGKGIEMVMAMVMAMVMEMEMDTPLELFYKRHAQLAHDKNRRSNSVCLYRNWREEHDCEYWMHQPASSIQIEK